MCTWLVGQPSLGSWFCEGRRIKSRKGGRRVKSRKGRWVEPARRTPCSRLFSKQTNKRTACSLEQKLKKLENNNGIEASAFSHQKREKWRGKMLRVSEDGNRRRDSSVANYRQLRQSLLDLQDAADRIFDTISERVSSILPLSPISPPLDRFLSPISLHFYSQTALEREKLTDLSTRIQKAKVTRLG